MCPAPGQRLPLEAARARAAEQQRRVHLARAVYRLGERPIVELVLQLATDEPTCIAAIERFASLEPETLRALGGDRFPPPPLRLVPR